MEVSLGYKENTELRLQAMNAGLGVRLRGGALPGVPQGKAGAWSGAELLPRKTL